MLPDRPGTFDSLYNLVYPRNITELSYRITHTAAAAVGSRQGDAPSDDAPPPPAHVYISYQPCSLEDSEAVIDDLEQAGFGYEGATIYPCARALSLHIWVLHTNETGARRDESVAPLVSW